MPQSPSILDALDAVQQDRGRNVPPARTSPPTAGADDYFRGQTLSRAQVQQLADQFAIDYETTRQGVLDRGGRVLDGTPAGTAQPVAGVPARTGPAPAPDVLSMLDEVQGSKPQTANRPPQPDSRSLFARAFDRVFTAPEFVTRSAARLANAIDDPSRPVVVQKEGVPLKVEGQPGFVAGAVQGAATLLTPGDVALTVAGAAPVARAAAGIRGGAEALEALRRGANVATAARGVERVANAESPADAAAGVAQVALGAAGSRRMPEPAAPPPPVRRALGPGASYVAAPDGRVAALGTDIPMAPAPDASFVRGVRGEYARREIAGQLPAGRQPIVTTPPPGSVPPPAVDASGGRGVPAAVVGFDREGLPVYSSDPAAVGITRPVRGELPPGPSFHADSAGNVATAEQADRLFALLDEVQGAPAPSVSSVRGVRPAVLERQVDATVPAKDAVRVRQYSGDAGAADAPFVSPEQRQALEVMREDLATFTPERGRLVRDPHDETSSTYARGGAGSPVGDDIRVISEQNVGNDQIAAAIEDLLAGKAPSNRLHTAALDAADGYLEGRSGYRGPTLPLDEPGGVAALAKRAERPAGAKGGAAPVSDDGFEAFARMFDEVDGPSAAGEPGELGAIDPRLAAHVGGGIAGAVYGGATGEDTKDRVKRAALFGVAGAAAPALARGGGSAAAGSVFSRMASEPPASPGQSSVFRGAARRTGKPIADPMAGMEPFVSKFSNPLVRDGVAQLLTENAGFSAQRRGVVSNDALGKFADEVRVHAERALPKGTALNAEAITAYARALQATQRKVADLASVVNAGKATDAELLALHAAKAEAEVIGKSLIGARAEAGRALGAFNFYRGILDTGDVTLIRDAVKAPGLREDAERLAKGLAEQPNDPLLRYRWLQQQADGAGLWDKARGIYYANILSGIKTHERNILGNVANVATNLVAHPFAVAADATRAAVTGAPRTAYLDELPAQTVGLLAGMQRGFRDALFTVRHGVSPDALSRSLSAGEAGKLDIPRVEFGGLLRPFNVPGRALDAADVFFRSAARDSELFGLAHAQATREGLRGAAFNDRVADLRAGLTPEGQQLQGQAATFARRSVFQEKPGALAAWLSQGNQVPGMRLVMPFVLPFVKTPANIARQGFEFSPAGVLMKAARAGGREGAQAQGRAAAGTLAAGYLAYLAATGQISGTGPKDAGDRAALMESGWRPNSIKVGDRWIGYQLFQPVSLQASLIANAFDAWREQGAKPAAAPDVLAQTIARSAGSFLDQSFLSGLFNVADAINSPERSASRFAGGMASAAVPFSGAARTVAQAMDDTVRAPRTVTDTVKAGIPGLSKEVPPRVTRFGEATKREGGLLQRGLDPFNSATEQDDPIARELQRVGVKLAVPAGRLTMNGAALDAEQSQVLKARQGKAVRQALEQLTQSPAYRAASIDRQQAMAEARITAARAEANTQYRREARRRGGAGLLSGSQRP